jgi:non-specific serine/threonine protein kinase
MLAEAGRSIYALGECEVDLGRRELRVLGAPVPVGARAFEIIELLVRSAGALVTKNELIDHVWPGTIVSDNTLQVHIAAIRKALGPQRFVLKTEAGRGYRLLGRWTARNAVAATVSAVPGPGQAAGMQQKTNLPATVTSFFGRAIAAEQLRDLVSAYRVVTLTGPGGIGKTTLALQVAHSLSDAFEDGAWLVELSALSIPELVPSAVVGVLGLEVGGGDITPAAVARAIDDKHLLLVLDNCEHLIDATARLIETFVNLCPRVTLLATSREVLRIGGEYVYRVPPLDVPALGQDEIDNVLGHSAVELFVARMRAFDSDFTPRAEDLPAVAAICRHLDGIPLAIEFAAARAVALGLQQVAAGLEDRFALLTSGRRTALPRHRTLRAVFDWSYELLSEAEQLLLRRLAIFPSGFSLNAAVAVMEGTGHQLPEVVSGIANLVDKSLMTLDRSEAVGRWRLLETTRAYALEKLTESGDAPLTARRHTEFYLELFAPFATESHRQAAVDDLSDYRREIDNLRAALTWAFSSDGDAGLGVELAAVTMDFWVAALLLSECCEWAGKALTQLGAAAGTRHEMALQSGFAVTVMPTKGMSLDARAALERSLVLAQEFDDVDYQQRATYGLWQFSLRTAQFRASLDFARRYEEIARRAANPGAQTTADMMTGVAQTLLGEHLEAGERLRPSLAGQPIAARYRDIVRGIDVRVAALNYVVINQWCRGLLDQAVSAGQRVIEEARELDHPLSLCRALVWPTPQLLLTLGELDTAERQLSEGLDLAQRHAMGLNYALGLCAQGGLAALRGDPNLGIELLRSGLARMRDAKFLYHYSFFDAELAAALGSIGHIDEGLQEIEAALQRALETGYLWFVPEIQRIKGELLLQQEAADRAVVEDLFRQSLNEAHRQQALYWELSAATSLADLLRHQRRDTEARAALAPVYALFTESFAATAVKQAKALLDQLTVSDH